MSNERIASINAADLRKGQSISPQVAWDYFVSRKPDTYRSWILEHGDESTAKAARIAAAGDEYGGRVHQCADR